MSLVLLRENQKSRAGKWLNTEKNRMNRQR